jgi:uncharacterized Ntn-hydrolase superfamily protein
MLGAVVTTSSMSVGSRCVWAEPGVGAVLTQHRTDPRLGPKILARLKKGEAPDAIVADLGKNEPGIGWRQLAVMAGNGKAAFFHGAKILSTKNGKVGRDCVAIGNIIRSTNVVDAMVAAFEGCEDQPLAERLMRGIEAGYAAGSEWKQVKSAALLVVDKESFPFVDLRVDLHAQPLVELRFLWELYEPTAENYVVRAVDPDSAPGAG